MDSAGRDIDTGLAWFLKGPRSYTGEDTVEISAHGSDAVLRAVVETALCMGARLAGPGEFTRRAFLNGQIDLLQAEGVVTLIQSSTDAEAREAYGALSGSLSERIWGLRALLVEAAVALEAGLDFAEEQVGADQGDPTEKIERVLREACQLFDGFRDAEGRQGGWAVVLAGRPNAGKSTLFNGATRSRPTLSGGESPPQHQP